MRPINAVRLAIYTGVAYFLGFYLGVQTVPEVACVTVDEKVWCGPIVKGTSNG